MNNREIAGLIQLLGNLMELHGEPDFRTKSYHFAARSIKSLDQELVDMPQELIEKIPGIGKAISSKVIELISTGNLQLLETYLQKTPVGIIEMFQIKGIGPKKIKLLWEELDVESIGELLYACNENRLITIKGFGVKTQQNIKEQIEFLQKNSNFFIWANIEPLVNEIKAEIKEQYPDLIIETVGDFANKKIVLEKITFLIGTVELQIIEQLKNQFIQYPIEFISCTPSEFYLKRIELTTTEDFKIINNSIATHQEFSNEIVVYEAAQIPFIAPEFRDISNIYQFAKDGLLDNIIELKDIKGIIHTHTKYSDGVNSIEEMAQHCMQKGYEYLVISDHSKSAFYANGLSVERIIEQHQEIDQLNLKYPNFKIYKSIESDILYDGSLDYEDNVLQMFDLIIASVHSNLRMHEEKAMERLIKAIENPYTTILGHLTGRLLLSRKGYPINHQKIIDACADNGVVVELNANPNRLDIDYKWIDYCQQKNVKIAINPDAHNLAGISDVRFGVIAARKGLLFKRNTLNTLTQSEFDDFISKS